MTLSSDGLATLRARIEASDLRPDAKERALALLNKEVVTEQDKQVLSELIQEDIEQDFAEVPGLNEEVVEDKEYLDLVAAREAELQQIEAEVEADRKDAEEVITSVNELLADVESFETELRIEDVKDNLSLNQ